MFVETRGMGQQQGVMHMQSWAEVLQDASLKVIRKSTFWIKSTHLSSIPNKNVVIQIYIYICIHTIYAYIDIPYYVHIYMYIIISLTCQILGCHLRPVNTWCISSPDRLFVSSPWRLRLRQQKGRGWRKKHGVFMVKLLPWKLTCPRKIGINPWKRRFLLETIVIRGHVSFSREGSICIYLVRKKQHKYHSEVFEDITGATTSSIHDMLKSHNECQDRTNSSYTCDMRSFI